MEYNTFDNLTYCYQFFLDMQGLLFYTHIPPIVAALLFAAFIYIKKRDRISALLAAIAVTFSLYATIDLLQWIKIDSGDFLMASWSILGLLSGLIFFFTHSFVHEFSTGQTLPVWMSRMWLIVFIPVLVFTPTTLNISGYDIRNCIAIEGSWFTNYYYALGVLAIVLMIVSVHLGKHVGVYASKQSRLAQYLVLSGSVLFIASFLLTGIIASYLVDQGLIPDFGLGQYGIAAMSVFIGFLAYVTAYYDGFNIKTLAAQILVIALIILIAAEFLFVSSILNRMLVAITLVLVTLFGMLLVSSVKKEVRQRELIEAQERELELANQNQESLLHFISHEIKGYLTEGQNAFAGIIEGDFGDSSEKVKEVSKIALTKMRQGVSTVMNILDASNLKKGTVTYNRQKCDFKDALEKEIAVLKPKADEKGLALTLNIDPDKSYACVGDIEKISEHVIRNLIDNAIRYTLKGSIYVSMTSRGDMMHLSVKDTGIGISEDDKKRLFTEGGHGKESIKVNVDSTGYGLFIAKQVVEAHGGKISVESEGVGKGSEFIVELPLA